VEKNSRKRLHGMSARFFNQGSHDERGLLFNVLINGKIFGKIPASEGPGMAKNRNIMAH
jgi:hypothetical protein